MKHLFIWLAVIVFTLSFAATYVMAGGEEAQTFTKEQMLEVAKEGFKIGFDKGVESVKNTCFIDWRIKYE